MEQEVEKQKTMKFPIIISILLSVIFIIIILYLTVTPEDIAHKVFDMECIAFPEAINLIDEKGVDFFWRRVENAT